MNMKPKGLVQVRDRLRLPHRSYHTEKQYPAWMTAYIAFCHRHEPDKTIWRHPKDCGRHEVEAFLTHPAVEKRVPHPPKITPCAPWCSCIGKS
ncbi:MAG: hypothetical protein GY801_18950 [bacterium]|nr:hypothetical protein [bacterium]